MSETRIPKVSYCKKCTLPSISGLSVRFDEDGICSGCRASENKITIDWEEREKLFVELLSKYKSDADYDCVIPVSGGKDSYFACHVARKYGLKPLLVTYHGNNFLPEGEENLQRMRDVFDADHIIFRPSTNTLVKLNRLGFKIHGDMNWHCHCGIFTYPVQMAVKYQIPLVWWGDHGFTEQGGMYSHNDFFEFTAKDRFEHALHGFDWHDFVEETEGLTMKDLQWAVYPSDREIFDVGVRGIFLSNYFFYDGGKHAEIVKAKYGWKEALQSFDRTYRKISNVDDMHENGIHDYLKYIKFGYGRCTDHTCYDIRLGRMTRDQAIELIKKYDHVKPSDLQRWLEYTDMTEDEFDRIADNFRNERVWTQVKGNWVKTNIWDE